MSAGTNTTVMRAMARTIGDKNGSPTVAINKHHTVHSTNAIAMQMAKVLCADTSVAVEQVCMHVHGSGHTDNAY